jgi:hypothetical protein
MEHDRAGREADAIADYRDALAQGLEAEDEAAALLGLGSSLRNVGQAAESVALLTDAAKRFPDHVGLRAFLVLALWSAGRPRDAVVEAIGALIADGRAGRYEQPIRRYLDDLR